MVHKSHIDPYGYEQSEPLPEYMVPLISIEHYLATCIGWPVDVPGGGSTGFISPNKEIVFNPTIGSAAFWINLSTYRYNDPAVVRGSCLVIFGTKWIMNTWIDSSDQWNN